MKAEKFIEDYLSQCDDTVVCVHAPDNCSSSTFSIYEWHHEPINETNLFYDVSQITAEVEKFNHGLNVVIHIYTECSCEEAE